MAKIKNREVIEELLSIVRYSFRNKKYLLDRKKWLRRLHKKLGIDR